jgi:dienelactone hydrolase
MLKVIQRAGAMMARRKTSMPVSARTLYQADASELENASTFPPRISSERLSPAPDIRRIGLRRLFRPTIAIRLAKCAPFVALVAVLLSISASWAADDEGEEALDPKLHERVITVPVGSPPSVGLQVTVFAPDGPGPFPLAVLNHGKQLGSPKDEKRYRSVYAARYFLSRGYAVVLPMMRGFAGSEGTTWARGCDLQVMGRGQARDIRDVIDHISQQDLGVAIDTSRVIVFGQSMGGWNTLAFGTLNMPQVKGLINFAGGIEAPSCPSWQSNLVSAAGAFGATTKAPSIWFYGDNDSKFGPTLWRAMETAYASKGASVETVAYGTFLKDSHNFLGSIEALPIWMPKLDAFLGRLGMPNAPLHPELLPNPYPQPSGFAAINDVAALPLADEAGRANYEKFLQKDPPRVFLLATNGSAISTNGGYDPLARGQEICKSHNLRCQAYAVDDQVVWPKPAARPAPSDFADLGDANAVPYLQGPGLDGYRRFLSLPKPRAFVVAPDGGWAFSSRDFDVLSSALRGCRQKHQDCKPYALDDNVVWFRP